MIPRQEVYSVIDSERVYQEKRWGGTLSNGRLSRGAMDRTLDEFALYILEYAEQLRHLAGTSDDSDKKLHAVRKVAALCVACMEAHGALKRELAP